MYEEMGELPELEDEGVFQVTIDKKAWKNGSPAFAVRKGEEFISMVQYTLYKKDKATGQRIRMGNVPVFYDTEEELYRIYDLTSWPALDGNLCEIELQNLVMNGDYNILYNIPVMIDSEVMNMRCVYWFDRGDFELFGVWDGYDNDSSVFNRNVRSLAQLAGREFNLLYETSGNVKGSTPYVLSPTMIMYRALEVEEVKLPPGTYELEFVLYDVFMRPVYLEPIELMLDGNSVQIQGDSWQGSDILKNFSEVSESSISGR